MANSQSTIKTLNQDLEDIKALQHYDELIKQATSVFRKYESAMIVMRTRLEIMNEDLGYRLDRNPIHHIESRLKEPTSAFDKLLSYGKPLTIESLQENIYDIAGLRVICSFPDDVYDVVDLVERQDDLEIMKVKDYIANPKPNGYRSLHVILRVPTYILNVKEYVPVEIQFRSIAMDLWASLEHDLRYKAVGKIEGIDSADELKDCSEIIRGVEERMQILLHAMRKPED